MNSTLRGSSQSSTSKKKISDHARRLGGCTYSAARSPRGLMHCLLIYIFFAAELVLCMVSSSHAAERSLISLDMTQPYADLAVLTSGTSVLYAVGPGAPIAAINAGHGTKGGSEAKTICHPDGSPKIVDGTAPSGAVYAQAVSGGMQFADRSEASVVLALARKIRDELLAGGISVLMIRDDDDVQLDNIARAVIANKIADVHVSVHFDGTSKDKGAFFCSVPDAEAYRSMEPVASMWREHERLGESIISSLKRAGIKIYDKGRMPMDLTQTSFSTIPSACVEFGDKASDISEAGLSRLAAAAARGIMDHLNEGGHTHDER